MPSPAYLNLCCHLSSQRKEKILVDALYVFCCRTIKHPLFYRAIYGRKPSSSAKETMTSSSRMRAFCLTNMRTNTHLITPGPFFRLSPMHTRTNPSFFSSQINSQHLTHLLHYYLLRFPSRLLWICVRAVCHPTLPPAGRAGPATPSWETGGVPKYPLRRARTTFVLIDLVDGWVCTILRLS